MGKYQKVKGIIDKAASIETALTGNDLPTAQKDFADLKVLISDLKTTIIGAEATRYTYTCTKCQLKCVIASGLDNIDTKYCLDEGKSGNADFKQTNIEVSVS